MTLWERQRAEWILELLDSGRPDRAREELTLLLGNVETYRRLLRNPRTARAARLAREAQR